MNIRRRIVPLSILKEKIPRKVKIAILDRAEARFIAAEYQKNLAVQSVQAHLAFLDELTAKQSHLNLVQDREPIDFRQEFVNFYIARIGVPNDYLKDK